MTVTPDGGEPTDIGPGDAGGSARQIGSYHPFIDLGIQETKAKARIS
jgi:hypothetical protein